MSQEIQQLQNEIILLKSRAFDLSEVVGQKQNELQHYTQLVGQICQLLGIDGSKGVAPEAIIGAISALVEPLPTPEQDQGEEPKGDQLLTEA